MVGIMFPSEIIAIFKLGNSDRIFNLHQQYE